MGTHSWAGDQDDDTPTFDEVRTALERMDLLGAEIDGRHGCLDAPVD
jgi:hypothetical protein